MEPPRESGGSSDPEPSRPWMFGGLLGSADLSWEWATERLSRARNYWIATTRPAGQPHSRPVWGVWLDNTFYFSTGSLAAQNLTTQPAITVHLESGNEVVILEGVVQQIHDAALLEQVVNLYNQKYHWNLDPKGVSEARKSLRTSSAENRVISNCSFLDISIRLTIRSRTPSSSS